MIVYETKFSDLGKGYRGKVRDIYDFGRYLLLVTTDRVSAFDAVMPDPIPDKGFILNQISLYWFKKENNVPNHIITAEVSEFPPACQKYAPILEGRSVLVKKANPLPIECIVRGYLTGSALKEYKETGRVCDYRLPPGLVEGDALPEPLFTPSTKARQGHDVNITYKEMVEILADRKLSEKIRDLSILIYKNALKIALKKGIIIADTKFEFGLVDGELTLIDELITPDSSRFWPLETYSPGGPQESLDKQYLRNYLISTGWDKNPPAPRLPKEIIVNLRKRYFEVMNRLLK
ncbi:MAG: phosphoribosylaminoimidazolesuccinocarboxamide synthase [Deltaproteobacteria bacterium]|nr:phosphoribosylaminoimidazolesuccinocarboxamide synthase [Deltaproteobacteria bacterium]